MFSILSVCSKRNTEGGSFRVFPVREWDFSPRPATNRVTSAVLDEQDVPTARISLLFFSSSSAHSVKTDRPSRSIESYSLVFTEQQTPIKLIVHYFSHLLNSDMNFLWILWIQNVFFYNDDALNCWCWKFWVSSMFTFMFLLQIYDGFNTQECILITLYLIIV